MNLGGPDEWGLAIPASKDAYGVRQEFGDAHSSDEPGDNITLGERRGIAVVNAFEERSIV